MRSDFTPSPDDILYGNVPVSGNISPDNAPVSGDIPCDNASGTVSGGNAPVSGNISPDNASGLYAHPFSADYWHNAVQEIRDLRKLTFAALMIALCMILGMVPSVTLAQGVRITWGFLARAVCALVCGPVLGLLFGFAEDILTFFLTGGGGYPFFFGYTLTTMLGMFIYALFFYRTRISAGRIFFAKLLTNVENVTLGALWTAILSGNPDLWMAYRAAAGVSAVKNLIMLPVQAILLYAVLAAVLPALRQLKLIPRAMPDRPVIFPRRKKLSPR